MEGHERSGTLRLAHADSCAGPGVGAALPRTAREEREHDGLAGGATRATAAGHRARDEEPDPWRTCFERDRDRILHAAAFRRLR